MPLTQTWGQRSKGGTKYWNKINPKACFTLTSRRSKKSRTNLHLLCLKCLFSLNMIWSQMRGRTWTRKPQPPKWLRPTGERDGESLLPFFKEWKMIRRAVTSKSSRQDVRRLMTNGCMPNESRKEGQSTRRLERITVKISYRKFAI